MQIADIMTAQPITVTPETTIADAARQMLQNHISGLPVVDAGGALVGIVTEGDLLRRAETGTERHRSRWLELLIGPGRLAADYVDAHARHVGQVMSSQVVSVSADDPLDTAVGLMEQHRIKRLPVVRDGKVVGIVSRADLVRVLLDKLTEEAKTPAGGNLSDAQMRERIAAAIDKEPWGPRFSVEVAVEKGVVHLNGTVTDDRERMALVVAAETVPGVKAVRDHLVWVEPVSGLVIPAPPAGDER